jgi:hypothetical protein
MCFLHQLTEYFKLEYHLPPKNPTGRIRQVGQVELLCASTHRIFQAGASPSTPEEPDTPPPHDPFTDSHAAATSSIDDSESLRDIETALPSGAAGIGVPVDDASESYSFYFDPDLAASGSSIASYKTERTVNSRKSRLNVRPRHKYADHGYLRPQDPGSSGVDDASVPKVCKSIDPRDTTTELALLCRPS